MIVAHLFGIPVEENAAQLGPAGAATLAMIAIHGRSTLSRLLARLRRH